jgi:hypothetical protein
MMMMHSLHIAHLRIRDTTPHRNGTKPGRDPDDLQPNLFHAEKPNPSLRIGQGDKVPANRPQTTEIK